MVWLVSCTHGPRDGGSPAHQLHAGANLACCMHMPANTFLSCCPLESRLLQRNGGAPVASAGHRLRGELRVRAGQGEVFPLAGRPTAPGSVVSADNGAVALIPFSVAHPVSQASNGHVRSKAAGVVVAAAFKQAATDPAGFDEVGGGTCTSHCNPRRSGGLRANGGS